MAQPWRLGSWRALAWRIGAWCTGSTPPTPSTYLVIRDVRLVRPAIAFTLRQPELHFRLAGPAAPAVTVRQPATHLKVIP